MFIQNFICFNQCFYHKAIIVRDTILKENLGDTYKFPFPDCTFSLSKVLKYKNIYQAILKIGLLSKGIKVKINKN